MVIISKKKEKKKKLVDAKIIGSLMRTRFLPSFKVSPQRLLIIKRKMATTVREPGGHHLN